MNKNKKSFEGLYLSFSLISHSYLILLSEKDTRRFVKKYNKPVMPKVCPMDEHTKRESIKEQIFLWQKDIPMVRANLFGAISRNLEGWKK